MRKRRFRLLFVSFGGGNDVFGFCLFVGEVETLFRIAFELWGGWKPCFLISVECFGRRNTVSYNLSIMFEL